MNRQRTHINHLALETPHHIFVHVVIASLLILWLTSCSPMKPNTEISSELEAHSYQPIPTNMPEILAIEGNADIKFPPSAHEIYAYTTGFQDIFIMVRFSMQASELTEFLDSTLCTQPLVKSSTSQNSSGDNFDWWTPDQAQYSEECFGENEHSHQQIIIDMSDKEVFIVYVSTSTY